jgi:hypothetical protein
LKIDFISYYLRFLSSKISENYLNVWKPSPYPTGKINPKGENVFGSYFLSSLDINFFKYFFEKNFLEIFA